MKWEKLISVGIRMPFYMNLFLRGMKEDVPRLLGWRPADWVVITEKQLTSAYFGPGEDASFQLILKKKSVNWRKLQSVITVLQKADTELLRFCRKLCYCDYALLKDKDILGLLKQFVGLFRIKFGLYPTARMVDIAMDNALAKFINASVSKDDLASLIENIEFGDFTLERIALLKIVKNVVSRNLTLLFKKSNQEIIDQLGRFYPILYYQIEKYAKDFSWVPVNHHVQPLNLDQAFELVRAALKDKTSLSELDKILAKSKEVAAKRAKIERKYRLAKKDLEFIKFLRRINFYNESRKAAMSKALLWSYPLFQTIADRLNIDVVSLRQLLADEMIEVLKKGRVSPKTRKLIVERQEFYVCLLHGGKLKNYSGQEAENFYNKEIKLFLPGSEVKELRGATAMPGKATGRVRVVKLEYQAGQVQEGEILVASMTDPDMLPAMKRAAAIVTDEGGITCHAAIVSREFKKPCVIGTKIATQVLKDGDLVEVDAKRGVVTKLS